MSSPPRGAVPTRIIRRKIEGRSCAIRCATMPPSEKNIAGFETKPVQKSQCMLCHAVDRVRHLASRTPDACAFEQNDLSPRCKSVGDRWIPVIECWRAEVVAIIESTRHSIVAA